MKCEDEINNDSCKRRRLKQKNKCVHGAVLPNST
jgi:hypothetical protein